MSPSISYDHIAPLAFGGSLPHRTDFDAARVVILPVPLERTTSYGGGTRHGPREILIASSHLELWDEELGFDVHGIGLYTAPEMELPFGELAPALAEIERVVGEILDAKKFPVVLGGEHSLTPAVVAAAARRHPELSVLQIDAHADLRAEYLGSPHSHACAMRRTLDHAVRLTQVGIRSLSTGEAHDLDGLQTTIFYDFEMRNHADWIDRVVRSLTDPVYITVDVDGLDPAIMPATGTPEPGGLSWYEATALLRAVISSREVVGVDLVELSPIPSMTAPNFLCAKLVYKMLGYRFGREITPSV
jgi:agmatinase